MTTRCRLCTSNDREALVEQLAGELWNRTRERDVDADWANAGPYWRARFILHAQTFVDVLQHEDAKCTT